MPEANGKDWLEHYRKYDTEDCPPEMGVVADIIPSTPGHDRGINQVKDAKNSRWYGEGDGEEEDGTGRVEEYAGEQDCRYCSGGAYCIVPDIIFVLAVIKQYGKNDPAYI